MSENLHTTNPTNADLKRKEKLLRLSWLLFGIMIALIWWPVTRPHWVLMAVLAGVLGETICDFEKPKTFLESFKLFWATVLVVGLAWELPEDIRKAQDTASLKQANLELQERLSPRYITKEQKNKFIELLSRFPKGPVKMGLRRPTQETRDYADQMADLLIASGFSIQSKIDYNENNAKFPPNHSLALFVHTEKTQPPWFDSLFAGFKLLGLDPYIIDTAPAPEAQGGVLPNEVMVFIIEKR